MNEFTIIQLAPRMPIPWTSSHSNRKLSRAACVMHVQACECVCMHVCVYAARDDDSVDQPTKPTVPKIFCKTFDADGSL